MASNQKVNIGNVTYRIGGGKANIGSTTYNITQGKANIGTTSYYINFPKPVNNVYTAQLYTDGNFSFQINDRTDETKTLKGSYTGFTTTTYNNTSRPWHTVRNNVKSVYFDSTIKPANTAYWCYRCTNLTSFNWSGLDINNVKTMYGMFDYCEKLNANTQITCGPNVVNFAFAYENCKLLTGKPVCGPNVVNMRYAYSNCYKLTGPPVCGDKVQDFLGAYFYCNNMIGPPAMGTSITSAGMAYYCCTKLTGEISVPPHLNYIRYLYGYCYNVVGTPLCSDNVVNFHGTYAGCEKLNGPFVCGNNVTDMSYAYQWCTGLTGPGIIGPKVTNAQKAFDTCTQLTEIGIRSNNISDMSSLVVNKLNGRRLNIYANGGTTTWTQLLQTGTNSIVGKAITWSNTNTYCYYNAGYNIYIYNNAFTDFEADRAYWPNASYVCFINSTKDSYTTASSATISAATAFESTADNPWYSRRDTITQIVFNRTLKPTSLKYWFINHTKLQTITGRIIVDDVVDMYCAFWGCFNYIRAPFMGDRVTNAASAYGYCQNMIGNPVCKGNVVNLASTYLNCHKLSGSPVCGDRVQDMSYAYANCSNLTGLPAFGSNVINAYSAYIGCSNLSASSSMQSITIGSKITDMRWTFANCVNLCNSASLQVKIESSSVSDMYHCFDNCNFSATHPLILNVPHGSATNDQAHLAGTYGLSSIGWEHPYPNFSYSTVGIQIYHYS